MTPNPIKRLSAYYYHLGAYNLYARVSKACAAGVLVFSGSALEDPLAKIQRKAVMSAHSHRVKGEKLARVES
jgi:hypothetical protein